MAIKTIVLCDKSGCNEVAELSFVGNVHTVDSSDLEGVGGGLIGNNLTDGPINIKPSEYEIPCDAGLVGTTIARVSHYCKTCTQELLGL